MELENIILREEATGPKEADFAQPRSVFIVDDEAMVGEVVSIVLGLEGFKTRLFTCPLDALDAFASTAEKPELLITDFVMQPFDGVELIERCRQLSPNLRAILYSGTIGDQTLAQRHAVADALLSKPFLPKELIQTVQSVLRRA